MDGWIGDGSTGCSRKITGLGVRGSSIHLTDKSRGNKCKDPETGSSLSSSGSGLKARG